MTPAQFTTLARLSDEQWRTGQQLDAHPTVLAALSRKGLIRGTDGGAYGMLAEVWTITPDGLLALEGADA